MNYVYLIGCTKIKQKYCCSAEEMYAPSTLFKASLNYALNHVDDKIHKYIYYQLNIIYLL